MEVSRRLATGTEAVQGMSTTVSALDDTDERCTRLREEKKGEELACILPDYKYYREGV